MKRTYSAINWNAPEHKFYDDLYLKQTQQFWLPEEIPVSDDKLVWMDLDPSIKEKYEKILAGLTLLDTQQSTGVQRIAEETDNLFIKANIAFIAGMESIHARSYSTIFQTLCTVERITELFEWVEETEKLQQKVDTIMQKYYTIHDKKSQYMAMVGSLCLEGICFYSGFYLPLWLAGQGLMVNSGEIINLILRDEKLHTVGIGFFAQELLKTFDEETQKELQASARAMLKEVCQLEIEYATLIYGEGDMLDEVDTFVKYNANYAAECLGLPGGALYLVTEEEVNPIVLNGISIETKNHDFFSTKGNGYIKSTNVEYLSDDDFDF